MSYRLYTPGERKGNRYYVARIWIWGDEHEFVCCDEEGRPTKDIRVARRAARAAIAKAKREGRAASLRLGAPVTFADAAARYLEGRGVTGQMETRVKLLAADPIFGQLPLADIVQADIDAAAQRVRRPKRRRAIISNASKNREVIMPAAVVLHYAAENKWCGWLRVRSLKQPKPENRRPAPGVGDILLDNTEGLKNLLLLLWFRQGWRIGESLTLQAEKINMAERTVDLWISKIRAWKSIELHEDVFFALANLEPPLPKEGRVFPWTRWQVYHWLRELRARLSVRFTPHMARHEFGSIIRDPKALVEVGTWSDEQAALRYVHGDKEFKRSVLAKVRGK